MFKKITISFLIWRVALFAVAFLAFYLLPIYGARFPYVDRVLTITHLPNWIWGFGGFDGVHYLRIAQNGYNSAVYYPAFFPIFPLLVRFFSVLIPKSSLLDTSMFVDPTFFYVGLILSNLFFILALYYLYKLFRIDYSSKVSWLAVILLLIFPTSFYFGSIYTESLFLLLSVLVLYESRKKNFLLAGIFCGIASATRIVGVFLAPVILIELYLSVRNNEIKIDNRKFILSVVGLIVSVSGLFIYMFYLWKNFNDPIYFITAQPFFGAQRSGTLIMLPQVIYRYIKIFITTPVVSLNFFIAALEFVVTLGSLTLLVIYFRKIRFSYWVFMFLALIVPTFSGSFSSMPRYILAAFSLLPVLVTGWARHLKLLMTLSVILAIILLSLFIRGYWVA